MYEHKVIGYVAFNREKTGVICDGDGCIVAGSERKMKEYIRHHSTVKDIGIIKKKHVLVISRRYLEGVNSSVSVFEFGSLHRTVL